MKRIFEKLIIPPQKRTRLQEIRLRVGRPVCLVCDNQVEVLHNVFTKKDMEEVFRLICNDSVYSKQNEILQGFVTLRGGHRAGICGTAVYNGSEIVNIRDISAINFRIAHAHTGCSDLLLRKISVGSGLLFCGAPCSGKTTMLRDTARNLSRSNKVALIDSRGELAASYKGEAQNDVGNSFVLDGYSKADGFDHALRCLSPDYIICDEIGSASDSNCIENAINSGVGIICSAHCTGVDELLAKPNLQRITRYFSKVVFLGNRERVGQVLDIINTDELSS